MSPVPHLLFLCAALSACGGNEDALTVDAEPAPTAQTSDGHWPIFQDQGAVFVKAGRASGLVMDASVTLLSAPVGDTRNRRIVGFGNVAEVWDDMVRIEASHLASGATGDGMVARRPEKSDLAVVTGLPRP